MFSRMGAPKDAWGIQPWKFFEPIFGGQNDFGHRVDHGDMVLCEKVLLLRPISTQACWMACWMDYHGCFSGLDQLDQQASFRTKNSPHLRHCWIRPMNPIPSHHPDRKIMENPRQVVSAFKRLSLSGVQAPAAAACACRVEPKVLFL